MALIVVGGVTAVIEGAPVSTFDLDIVSPFDEPNIDRLAQVLEDLEALIATKESAGHPKVRAVLDLLEETLSERRRHIGDGRPHNANQEREAPRKVATTSARITDGESRAMGMRRRST